VENAKDEGEGEGEREGEEEEQWLAVKMTEVDGELLSIVQCEQWRMQKTKEKEKGKGKRKSSGWWWKQRRPVVS